MIFRLERRNIYNNRVYDIPRAEIYNKELNIRNLSASSSPNLNSDPFTFQNETIEEDQP